MLASFEISDCCQEDSEKSDIVPSINSDHSAIVSHLRRLEIVSPFFKQINIFCP